MGFNMDGRLGVVGFVMLWLCAVHCMGQVTPRSVVSEAYFNNLRSAIRADCEGKNFYTYSSFITTAEQAGGFGTTGSAIDRKREIAAFFGNVFHETGSLCYVSEINKSNTYCEPSQGPCASGKSYYGRGPLQLTGNANYAAAGRALGFDGINNPDIVAQNPTLSFRTAFWFWMNNCHNAITSGQGFGATIRAINGNVECNGRSRDTVANRVSLYQRFCRDFGVDPGPNLSC